MSTRKEYMEELDRLVDRVRSMSLVRLAAELPPCASRADAVRALTSDVAAQALRSEGLPDRPVPVLGDESVGDQLAVVAHDLAVSCDDEVVLESFAKRFRELRLAL